MKAMTCSQCWSSIPARSEKCPRCGANVTGTPPSFTGLFKAYPWLGVVLALSVLTTLWIATRRPPPPPEPIPPAVEPVTVAPAPAPEPEPETVFVHAPAPEPEPEAPAPAAVRKTEEEPPPPPSASAVIQPDGTWRSGPGAPGSR